MRTKQHIRFTKLLRLKHQPPRKENAMTSLRSGGSVRLLVAILILLVPALVAGAGWRQFR